MFGTITNWLSLICGSEDGFITTNVSSLNPLDIKVYPNPTNDKIFIHHIPAEAHLRLIDSAGHICWQDNAIQTETYSLDELAMLPNGSYILQITTVKSATVQKIIKY